ncbi:MAG TPA: hypothetical protein VMV69_09115 [Pirellulales bacterium]|nr:hypothetical protein [Pirellulales bacterium]
MKTKTWATGIGLVLLLGAGPKERPVARAAPDDAPGEAVGAEAVEARETMLRAARRTNNTTEAAYDAGNRPFSDLYAWSRRWLEAERAGAEDNDGELAALKDHSARMTQLYRKVKALHVHGVRGGEAERFHAAQFQVAEAELWLVAAGGTDDDAPGVDAGAAATKARQAMLKAAKKTYAATQVSYQAGKAPFSETYAWSRRWLEAERALAKDKNGELAALKDHWKRMRPSYLKIKALYLGGIKGGEAETFGAAEFYLAEAELWLIEAGGTVPDDLE